MVSFIISIGMWFSTIIELGPVWYSSRQRHVATCMGGFSDYNSALFPGFHGFPFMQDHRGQLSEEENFEPKILILKRKAAG